MRSALLVIGLICLVTGGLLLGGVINLGSDKEVLRIGDTAIDVSKDGIKVSDRGRDNRNLGIGLLVVGGIGVLGAALKRK